MTEEDLEEVVSDVFLVLWNHRTGIKSESIRGWLAKVAKNKAVDKMRAIKPTIPIREEDDYMEEPDRTIFLRHYYGNEKLRIIAKEPA